MPVRQLMWLRLYFIHKEKMISSLDNKTVKELTKLHQKKYRDDCFLLLDEDLIKEALESKHLIQLVYTNKKPFEFENSLEVSQEVLDKISKKENLSYIGVSRFIEERSDYQNRVLLLDHLQDPLNIGRIMEAAMLFGFDSIILSEDSADIYNEKCLANCKGGIYKLNISHKHLDEEISKLKNNGFKVYATALTDNTKDLYEVNASDKMAFILGNEGSGVRKELIRAADETIKIDMCNIDSLNVGMAASIVMYRFKI